MTDENEMTPLDEGAREQLWADTHEGPENEWAVEQARAAWADECSATLAKAEGES